MQRGSCLCGACAFSAEPEDHAHICHCGQCRKWSGGMFLAVSCGTSVAFDDGAPVGSYKASDWGERLFCTTCGTSLVWQMQDGTHQNVSIQLFDDPAQFELTRQIFIDAKPANYALVNKTKNMTEAELMARMNAGQA